MLRSAIAGGSRLALALTLACGSSNEPPAPGELHGAVSALPASATPKGLALTTADSSSQQTGRSTAGALPSGSFVPRTLADSSEPAPFVLLLHGYGGAGASFARFFHMQRLAERHRFVFLAPDGTADERGQRFWNAGPACCDFAGIGVDHVAELRAVIEQARAATRVDASRVYVVGYSNGGFMAHRLACEVAGIRGIASVAGAAADNTEACAQAPEVVIEVHGDADTVVAFDGGRVLGKRNVPAHRGALSSVKAWATRLGCGGEPTVTGSFDFETDLPGLETERLGFACAPGIALFRVAGAGHSLAKSELALDQVLAELMR